MFKQALRKILPAFIYDYRNAIRATRPIFQRTCPMCGFEGNFRHHGKPPRVDALCPRCESLERHRLLWSWLQVNSSSLHEPILHFAAEPILEKQLRKIYQDYRTADLFRPADIKLNIEDINLEDRSVSTIICNHVLEHVNDHKALSELCRILNDDGTLVASVPIVEGWEHTYEKPEIEDPLLREVHFGQHDHIRYYGRDFRQRLRAAGFHQIEEVTAEGEIVIKYELIRGEKIFICRKK